MNLIIWTVVACKQDKLAEQPSSATQEPASEVLDLDDQWWQNATEDPYQSSEPEEGDAEEEESLFWGLLYDDGTYGFSGVYDAGGCEWEAEVSGEATTPCPSCDQAYTITFAIMEIVNDDNCPEELSAEAMDGLTVSVGFGGETAWLQEEETWEEFGYAFAEGSGIGWYMPL